MGNYADQETYMRKCDREWCARKMFDDQIGQEDAQ
jgi:hypothetical protein